MTIEREGFKSAEKTCTALLRSDSGIEAGLTKFLRAYTSFLGEMSKFATPITTGLLYDLQRCPSKELRIEAANTAFEKLEAKEQDFLVKFYALPVPDGAAIVRTPPYKLPLTDLFVSRMEYGGFELSLHHLNNQIDFGEQTTATLLGSALPGSSLRKDARLQLYEPAAPKWEFKAPCLLKVRDHRKVRYNGSVYGFVENDFMFTSNGAFWSTKSWFAGERPKIRLEPSFSFNVPYGALGTANFALNVVGSGELDAFVGYVRDVEASAKG